VPSPIFISHSSRDVEVAQALKGQLQRVGLTAFIAPDDMHGVDAWPEQLAGAIEGCSAFVLILSAAANESEHVAREVSIAVGDAKPMLVLRFDETRPTGPLRYLLQLRQQIDIFPGPLERYFERVLSELRTMLSTASQLPTDSPVTAGSGACPNCGTKNPPRARFCSECSTLLLGTTEGAQDRRVVTILFCDIVGSTAMGERLDAETTRRVMARYFAETRKIVIHHGGMVEKFIGDAVMAVFGLPTLHEDDALRAMRAAVEIQAAVGALSQGLKLDLDVGMSVRIGIATGEVVASDPSVGGTLITGDAVNTSARLEQAAAPDQILVSAFARDLVRDAIVAEPVPAVAARGKAIPVPAYRLLSVVSGAPGHARRLDAPMVGRERELRGLHQSFDDAVSDRSCRLFTILGSAGVGKSRLVAEFLAGLAGQARMLEGRCLPYGEGITYWPVREIVHAAAGIDEGDDAAAARSKVAGLLASDRERTEIERCVARAVGLSDEAVAPEELTWGIRRFLEVLAEQQPLVIVFDDIQWAEPTFLDLIEHIADWARDAPLLLVCPARPELLDVRPGWGGGKMNVTSFLLEPLPAEASQRLIEGLGAGGLPPKLQDRIAAAAEGNPLFIEEMVNMLRVDGVLDSAGNAAIASAEVEDVRVPPTIRALLAARLDQLVPDERAVAERASVIGRVFERRALTELSPETERLHLSPRLLSLVRKELVRPDRSEVAEEAYRFRHLLIRDAAYEALPKSQRAVLHERFAQWLIAIAGDRIAEYEEVIAFHLDQARQSRLDLGESGQTTLELAAQAADWYIRAARRADAVLDYQSSKPLWQRVVSLLDPASQAWLDAAYELATALAMLGDVHAARDRFGDVVEAAADRDPALSAMARIGSFLLNRTGNATWSQEMERIVRDSLPTLEARGDHRHLAKAYSVLWMILVENGDPAAYEASLSNLLHAQGSGDPNARRSAATDFIQSASRLSPPEARQAVGRFVDAADLVGASRIYLLGAMALVEQTDGNLAAAQDGLSQAVALADRFGQPELMAAMRCEAGENARLRRDFSTAEPLFRRAFGIAVEHELSNWVPYAQALLATSLFYLGRETEAEALLADLAAHRGEHELADVIAQVVKARLLGRRRQLADGREMLRDAIRQLPPMAMKFRTEAQVEEIRMLKEAGLEREAQAAATQALSEIAERPAPLYVSMINEALEWRRHDFASGTYQKQ
jgi:class 3 adenylate cyclase